MREGPRGVPVRGEMGRMCSSEGDLRASTQWRVESLER